jgi:hypothetical protein
VKHVVHRASHLVKYTGPSARVRSDFTALLARSDSRELGEVDQQMFLGLYHERCWSTNTINLSQPRHVADLLSKHASSKCRFTSSPMDDNIVLTATTDADKCEHLDLSTYTAIVGSLMYMAFSRPDLCYTASMLARFVSRPSDQHVLQAHRALRQLSKTSDYRLAIGRAEFQDVLTGWSDSDHANCLDSRRFVAGQVILMLGSVVHWRSVRQSTVAKSTVIAEYYAACSAADEACTSGHSFEN